MVKHMIIWKIKDEYEDKDTVKANEEAAAAADEAADAEWDKAHRGIKTIIITTEVVQDNASFYCEIIL